MSPFILLGFLMGTILIAISAVYGELPAFPWTYRGKLKALKLDMDVLRYLEEAKESPELIAILRGHVQRRSKPRPYAPTFSGSLGKTNAYEASFGSGKTGPNGPIPNTTTYAVMFTLWSWRIDMANDAHLRALLSPKMQRGLCKVVASFERANIQYALVGGLAFDHYAKEPRFTRDLDFVVAPEQWQDAIVAVRKAGFVRGSEDDMLTQLENRDRVRVDLLFGVGDPEESARELSQKRSVLGVRTNVAPPETLVWMYLLSDQPRHEEDARALIRRGIHLQLLAAWLKHHNAHEELMRLGRMVSRIRGERERR